MQTTFQDHVELNAIDIEVGANGEHAFIGIFSGPKGLQRLALPPEALMTYAVFQHVVLVGTGSMWGFIYAEGAPAEIADRTHRLFIGQFLAAFWQRARQHGGTPN